VITPEHFHVGIVVADMDEAKRSLSESLGIEWLPTRFSSCPVADDEGARIVPLKMSYSASPPFIELIEEVPGTVWVTNEHSNLHHIGFWSSDLAGDLPSLVSSGCPIEIVGFTKEQRSPARYSYHTHPLGVRIEIVDTGSRQILQSALESHPKQGA
jgi:hypothetical protein